MPDLSENELIEAIKKLTPLVETHALKAEQQRKPVDCVMQAIKETGVYRYFVPQKFGGYEYSTRGFMEIGMALGEACVSTAWVTTFCMEHNWLFGLFGQEAQEDIFGNQPYIIAPGALAPSGKATQVDGGYQVTGRWQWATGIMHADWAMVSALTPEENGDDMFAGMYILPVSEVKILDTWHIDGMVGTGSNDVAVEDVFIPAHRMVNLSLVRDGQSPGAIWHNKPLYRMPMLPFLGLTATAPAIGAASKAVQLFRDRMTGRNVYGTSSKQSERGIAQARLANATVEMESIETQLFCLMDEVTAWGESGMPCPELERARLRLHVAQLIRRARDVVRSVVEACGASAHFLDNPLQRIQRDLNTLSCHTVFDIDVGSELYGRLQLGLSANSII